MKINNMPKSFKPLREKMTPETQKRSKEKAKKMLEELFNDKNTRALYPDIIAKEILSVQPMDPNLLKDLYDALKKEEKS